jgi:hypothetical protein
MYRSFTKYSAFCYLIDLAAIERPNSKHFSFYGWAKDSIIAKFFVRSLAISFHSFVCGVYFTVKDNAPKEK